MNNRSIAISGLIFLALAGWLAFSFSQKDTTSEKIELNTKKVDTEESKPPLKASPPKSTTTSVDIKPTAKKKTPIVEKEKNRSIPDLDIQLHGVFLTDWKKNTGFAIISHNGRPQKTYQPGSKFSENVVLKSLTKDSIIIDNHGKLEEIKVSPSSSDTVNSSKQTTEDAFLPGINAPPLDDLTPPPFESIKDQEHEKQDVIPPPPEHGPYPDSF